MTRFNASASMGALALALTSVPVLADTTVSDDSTTARTTSTAGDITISDDGSITLSSGNAITVDSDNDVTVEGDIKVGGADDATGIYVNAGTDSIIHINDDATIKVTENYVVDEDDNDDGKVNGNVASASNRYGLYVAGDASGNIHNEGSIVVEGQDSGGIVLAGDYTGDIYNEGSISVIGDNSVGISTQGVDGDVTVEGSVAVVGAGASAININGDVTGAVVIQGSVTRGYSYTDDDGQTITLSNPGLNTGTAAVSITGSVANGIQIAASPSDNDDDDDDEDNDGTEDDEEGTGSITNYGNGAALQVGGEDNITVGAVENTAVVGNGDSDDQYSLVIEGSVSSTANYTSSNAYGVVIGGEGGNVDLTYGIGVSGTVSATSINETAVALLINEGSTVGKLYNSGTISASLSTEGDGTGGTTIAIQDLSGTLTSIENTGYITASGSGSDVTTAIDVSANTSGVTITQSLNDEDAESREDYADDNDGDEDPTIYARITGDILLGSGNDTISASTGEIIGDTSYGAGDDTLTLTDDAYYEGDVSWGTGTATVNLSGESEYTGTMDFSGETGTITISDTATYQGQFSNADNVTVTVNSGGTLIPDDTVSTSVGTVYVASGGNIGVYVEGDSSSTIVADSATLESGAGITAEFDSLATAEGTYTVLTSSDLNIEGTLDLSTDLPFIYTGEVTNDDSSIYLTVERKTVDELGLNRSEGSAWDAIYATAQNDDNLTDSLLDIEDSATLREQVSDLLPDHAGGVFHAVTQADRLVARHISDETSLFDISDAGGWLEPIYYRSSKENTGTAKYKISGWGLSGGFERSTSIGNVGVSYAWMSSTVKNDGGSGKLDIGQHDFGVFWRKKKGPLLAYARIGASKISIDSKRTYTGTIDDEDFEYTADGSWNGWLFSGLAGASYKFQMSRRFTLKPKLEVEQMWLKENGYEESSDDSDAIPLTVADRTSKSLSATPTITAAYSVGRISPEWHPLTFQLEAGRRQALSGKLGNTTAYFNGNDNYDAGDAFTIAGESVKSAWIGELSMLAGGYDFTWKISTRMERTADTTDLSLRAGLSVAF